MDVKVLMSFKQKISPAKVVQVYISKLNTELIDRLRQLKSPSSETVGRCRKVSGCHTKEYACLMDEKVQSLYFLNPIISSETVQHRLCRIWSGTPKTDFVFTRLKCELREKMK